MDSPSHFFHLFDQLCNFHKRPPHERSPLLLEQLVEALDMDNEQCFDPASGVDSEAPAGPVANYVQALQQSQDPASQFILEKVAESLAEVNYAKAHMYRTAAELQASSMAEEFRSQQTQLRFQFLQLLIRIEEEDRSRRFECAIKLLSDPAFNTEEMAPLRQSASRYAADYFNLKNPLAGCEELLDKLMSIEPR